MKRNRFIDEQIIGVLKEHKASTPVSELCRKHGVGDTSISKWKAKLGGRNLPVAERLKTLKTLKRHLRMPCSTMQL